MSSHISSQGASSAKDDVPKDIKRNSADTGRSPSPTRAPASSSDDGEDPLADLEAAANLSDDSADDDMDEGVDENVEGVVDEHVDDYVDKGVDENVDGDVEEHVDDDVDEKTIKDADFDSLVFTSWDQARDTMKGHLFRQLVFKDSFKPDDVEEVRQDPVKWVTMLKKSFAKQYRTAYKNKPPASPETAAQPAWDKWQNDASEKFNNNLLKGKTGSDHVEALCWKLFKDVLAMHQNGYSRMTFSNMSESAFEKRVVIKCSVRLESIAGVISDYPLIRSEIVTGEPTGKLIALPEKYANAKIANLWVNTRKAMARRQSLPQDHEDFGTHGDTPTAKRRKSAY
ncbi:hypothetical protein KC318_g11761 [Hortaea werneckii]|uniref:Uncharacterized protein n=1 Tax=Hortaea werneckii TaxID=91943 RepID=A0A3M7BN99_HORWE|nr:hypothetical protein KC334_g9321 [Hortaea werneckii]KAI7007285.1 hypothetical protein KC355_g7390 [Hortaea werneckii]KAI7657510.1 hypothetical protein KC318_g11761 [Hortaea werneckii]RMY17514.1 hypothetical protein D0867_05972 [Hortaea werneckii]RMY40990.1 hypothetical protein D0866_00909 [Hortaea werneckii]